MVAITLFLLNYPLQVAKDFDFQTITNEINDFEPDIVWVGLGAPKQERVIEILYDQVIEQIPPASALHSISLYSGIPRLTRAPEFIRTVGT